MIRFANVTKSYSRDGEKFYALHETSLQFAQGSSTLIIGANGAGKSTLLRLAGGIIRPDSGRIYYDDEEISGMAEPFRTSFRLCHFGFHFQGDTLLNGLSIYENIALATLPTACSSFADKKEKMRELFARLQLGVPENTKIEQLSGGQKQKVSLVRALINEPEVLFADEPTNHLDASSAKEIRDMLYSLKDEGRSIVVVSHDPLFERASFDTAFHVDNGEVTMLEKE